MPKTDRRIAKSQAAIKNAVTTLMAEKDFDSITIQDIADEADLNRGTIYLHYTDKYDLLNSMIEEHIEELRDLCQAASDVSFEEGNYVWYDYFEQHQLFFSTMLNSKGAPHFRRQFIALVVNEFRMEVDTVQGKNSGLEEELFLQFFASATVGAVEWWFKHDMPVSARMMAKQTGILLDRNFD